MPGKRKSYTPEFKFKVVLESLQRDTTIEELCRKFDVPNSAVSRWRQEFQQNGPEVFADKRNPKTRTKAEGYAAGESPDELKKLIGELTVQNALLKNPGGSWVDEQTAPSGTGPHAVCFWEAPQ